MKDLELFAAFRGERYADPRSLARRLAPPYDVISPARRAELAAQDPCNIVHVDLPEAVPGGDPYPEAARLLARWRSDGTLVRDAEPTAYVLRTSGPFPDGSTRQRTGPQWRGSAEGGGGGTSDVTSVACTGYNRDSMADDKLYKSISMGSGTFLITKPKRKAAKRRQSALKHPRRGARK